jgi:hypothetical protein
MKRSIEKAWGSRDAMLKEWRVDTENGIVYSRKTGKSMGSIHNTTGYVIIAKWVNGKCYSMKRSNVIWWGKYQKMPPVKMHIDHINGDKTNDRIENLQILTPQQNLAKRKKSTKGSSKYMGVQFNKRANKFRALVEKWGKKYHFGCHYDEKEAAIARDRGMIKLYEKEMRETGFIPPLNFPEILQDNKEPLQLELF